MRPIEIALLLFIAANILNVLGLCVALYRDALHRIGDDHLDVRSIGGDCQARYERILRLRACNAAALRDRTAVAVIPARG